MLTLIVIFALSLGLLLLVMLPLLGKGTPEAIPDERDPLLIDLEEERDALYKAIRELEGRDDLPQARREQLRARYEAKAALVLRRIDELGRAPTKPVPPPVMPRRRPALPVTAIVLVGVGVASVALLSNFVLPRVGSDGTVTTSDPLRIERAREIQRLQRLVSENPSSDNLLTLADAQWTAENYPEARDTYRRLEETANGTNLPNIAYRRLGFMALDEGDFPAGLSYLEQAYEADPHDAETLFALGDVYYMMGRTDEALTAWEGYAALPNAVHDEALEFRLSQVRTFGPLEERVAEDPSEENLLALADAYWDMEQRNQAATLYLQVVQDVNPRSPQAVRRLGMALFFSGRNSDAMQLLEIARQLEPDNLETLLFLGNSYFSESRYEEAIDAWEDYVAAAGGPEAAGRVPGLIVDAQRALGQDVPDASPAPVVAAAAPAGAGLGESVFMQNCSSCHGVAGGGGVGPRLAGNPVAGDVLAVRRVVATGRGLMPAFGGQLDDDELDAVARYVSESIYPQSSTSR